MDRFGSTRVVSFSSARAAEQIANPFVRSLLLTAAIFLPRVRGGRSRQDCLLHVRVGKRTQPELVQWRFVVTLTTLESGLVPLPLYARNR